MWGNIKHPYNHVMPLAACMVCLQKALFLCHLLTYLSVLSLSAPHVHLQLQNLWGAPPQKNLWGPNQDTLLSEVVFAPI